MADTIFGIDAATVLAFDQAYIASRDPEVRKLHQGEAGQRNPDGTPQVPITPADRYALALQLAPTHDVDWQIDALGSDPYFTMLQRQMGGVQVFSYVRNTALKISINPADFPKFPDPIVVSSGPGSGLVGALAYGNVYFATQTAINQAKAGALPNGYVLTENGAQYRFQIVQELMGASYTWVKQ